MIFNKDVNRFRILAAIIKGEIHYRIVVIICKVMFVKFFIAVSGNIMLKPVYPVHRVFRHPDFRASFWNLQHI